MGRSTIKKRDVAWRVPSKRLLLQLLNALWSIALPFMMRHEKRTWLLLLHILASFFEDPSGIILLYTPPGMCMTFNYHESLFCMDSKFGSSMMMTCFIWQDLCTMSSFLLWNCRSQLLHFIISLMFTHMSLVTHFTSLTGWMDLLIIEVWTCGSMIASSIFCTNFTTI